MYHNLLHYLLYCFWYVVIISNTVMNNLVYILDVQVYIWWVHFQKLNYCSGHMYICPFDKYCQIALLRGYKYLPHLQQYMGKSYVLINKTCYQTFGPLLIWQMKNSISVPFLISWVKLSFLSYAYVPFVFTFLSELPVLPFALFGDVVGLFLLI